MHIKKIIQTLLMIIFSTTLTVSVFNIVAIQKERISAANEHQELVRDYKPVSGSESFIDSGTSDADNITDNIDFIANLDDVNQTRMHNLKQQYGDVVGWITMQGTRVDYPFVQAADNQKYLRKDLNLRPQTAGTIFMDFRNRADFSDFATVLYGHNMRNRTMFGSLNQYREADFFKNNNGGIMCIENTIYRLDVFAVSIVDRYDDMVYSFEEKTEEQKADFLKHIKKTAIQYREIDAGVEDNYIILSTCAYDYINARLIVIAKFDHIG